MENDKEYLGKTGSSDSLLPLFERLANEYGGKLDDMSFDFTDNPDGLEKMKADFDNPVWLNLLLKK